jgi:AraC-like DNA-binding protein
VFPGPAVGIPQAGRDPLVATSNETVLYDAGTTYRRQLVSPEGDHSVFVELAPALAADVGPFPGAWVPAPGAVYAYFRLLANGGADSDPLSVEESVLAALNSLCMNLARQRRSPAGRDARHAIEAVKAVIATRLPERLTLAQVAAEVHYSPYHLARLFREITGQSLCSYRTGLRVRCAVDRVIDPSEPLTTVAAEFGFASHSHLTTAFRRVLGVRPSDLRRSRRSRVCTAVADQARGGRTCR